MTFQLLSMPAEELLDLEDGRVSKRRRIWEEEDEEIAIPGDKIADPESFMRGHGTYLQTDEGDEDASVLASVAGRIEHVNRLVTVKPLRSRYRPEVGDLIVGRISEVGPKRWKVDAGGRQDALLPLSSINLPGGVQRRKLESDELQMRAFFAEGDLLVAEVQAFHGDGVMSLHTRSLKYGKLRNGCLVTVSPSLIMRLKSHFHSLPCGVDLIIGLNGRIWVSSTSVSATTSSHVDAPVDAEHVSSAHLYSNANDAISLERREAVARVAAVIRTLAAAQVPLNDAIIARAYEASLSLAEGEDDDAMVDESLSRPVKSLVPGSIAASGVVQAVQASA